MVEVKEISTDDLALWQRIFKRDRTHRAYELFFSNLRQANRSGKFAAALLHRSSGSVAGGVILACVREQPLAYVEINHGERYNHLGGLYRIIIQGA